MSEEINILEKFKSKEFGFNGRGSIVRCIVGDNVFIIKDNNDSTYNFIKISKSDYDKFYENEKEKKNNNVSNAIIKYINFDQTFFNKNKENFIKSLNEQQLNFDDVKQMTSEKFKSLKVSGTHSQSINIITPELIPGYKPEEKEELMGDDDEEDGDDESKMTDGDEEEKKDYEEEEKPIQEEKKDYEEEEKEQVLNDSDFNQIIKDNQPSTQKKSKKKKKDKSALTKTTSQDSYLRKKEELKRMKEEVEKENEDLYGYYKKQKKQRSGKMGKEDMDVFDQLTRELNFIQPNEKAGKSYLRVGDDVIFIRKPQQKSKGSSRLGENNYLAVKLNKEDLQRIYTEKDLDKVEAEYFNFSTDYFDRNKDKIKEAIKNGEFILDDELKRNKEISDIPEKFKIGDLRKYDVIPSKKNFDYVNILGLKNGNISKEKRDDGQQLIKFSKDGKNVTVNLPNKYLSNGYPDSLLKLIVGVSENNKGEVDFKEIGEIQDLNGDITNLYSDMQDLKSKINSSNNAEEKERLLIKYNKKRLKLEDSIKKYSKEAYRLSTLKKKKATMATHKYLMNKLNKLKT